LRDDRSLFHGLDYIFFKKVIFYSLSRKRNYYSALVNPSEVQIQY